MNSLLPNGPDGGKANGKKANEKEEKKTLNLNFEGAMVCLRDSTRTLNSARKLRINKLQNILREKGDRIFKEAPEAVTEMVNGGRDIVPMLISTMNYVDYADAHHVSCTAVAIAIKIVNEEPSAVSLFIDALERKEAPMRYVVDVLERNQSPEVRRAIEHLLNDGLMMMGQKTNQAKGISMATLAISAMGNIGDRKDALALVDYITSEHRDIRTSASNALKNYSKRSDVDAKDREAVACKIFKGLAPDKGNYYALKVEVLEEGRFRDAVQVAVKQYWDSEHPAPDPMAFRYMVNAFFGTVPEIRYKVYEMLEAEDRTLLKSALDAVRSNIRKMPNGGLPGEEMNYIYEKLKHKFWDASIPDRPFKFHMAEIFSCLDDPGVNLWKSHVYSKSEVSNEMRKYVLELYTRPAAKKEEKERWPTVLIVDDDQQYGEELRNVIKKMFEKKERRVSVTAVRDYTSALAVMAANPDNVVCCIVSQNIGVPAYVGKKYEGVRSWHLLLKHLSRGGTFSPPLIVAMGLDDPKNRAVVDETLRQSNYSARVVDKLALIENSKEGGDALYGTLEKIGVFKAVAPKKEAASGKIDDYLASPAVLRIVAERFGAPATVSREHPFGEHVKITRHEWGAVIEETVEPQAGERRIRYLMLMPTQQSAVHEHPGIESADMTVVGSIQRNDKVHPAVNAIRAVYDTGGEIPSGNLEESEPVSKGEKRPLIEQNGRGRYHGFRNTSSKVMLLQLDEMMSAESGKAETETS